MVMVMMLQKLSSLFWSIYSLQIFVFYYNVKEVNSESYLVEINLLVNLLNYLVDVSKIKLISFQNKTFHLCDRYLK